MDHVVESWRVAAEIAPGGAGVFLDFDGTLAPIVADPGDAVADPDAPAILGQLSRRFARVAVLSGRPVAYLSSRLAGADRTELFGIYGLERARVGSPVVDTSAEAEAWRGPVSAAADDADRVAPQGVVVERKGLTVTLHYRRAPRQRARVEELAAHLAEVHGLVAQPGKMSVELRPPVEIDKGTVIRELGAGLGAVLFAGDDRGDLPAFTELARMRSAGKETLAIAVGGPETPIDLVGLADLVVDGPRGVVEVLSRLVGPT